MLAMKIIFRAKKEISKTKKKIIATGIIFLKLIAPDFVPIYRVIIAIFECTVKKLGTKYV